MNFNIALTIFGIATFFYLGMRFIIDSLFAFSEEANRIKQMIDDNQDETVIHEAIIRLREKSFHRSTAKRLTEVCVMFEKKYNRAIVKH